MTPKLMFGNHKGGVGKTTTSTQVAAALARRGCKVLFVDFDPQANATRRLGIEMDPAHPIVTVSEVVAANEEGIAQDATVPCQWVDEAGNPTSEAKNIDVIPSRPDLINREGEAGSVGAIRRLKKALAGEWLDEYDVVIIDTRPDMGHLVQMAMAASDSVILITDAMHDGVEAAMRVSQFIAQHAEDMHNPGLTVGGVIVTRWRDTAENRFQLEGLSEHFGNQLWPLGLPYTRLAEGKVVDAKRDWIPEWARFAEADGAAASLSAWSDRKGRETVEVFDAIAARVIQEFEIEGAKA